MELRISKNLSQEKLGHRVQLSSNQVGRIERGEINMTISTMNNLALAMDMTFAELTNFDVPGAMEELKVRK